MRVYLAFTQSLRLTSWHLSQCPCKWLLIILMRAALDASSHMHAGVELAHLLRHPEPAKLCCVLTKHLQAIFVGPVRPYKHTGDHTLGSLPCSMSPTSLLGTADPHSHPEPASHLFRGERAPCLGHRRIHRRLRHCVCRHALRLLQRISEEAGLHGVRDEGGHTASSSADRVPCVCA